jgi:carbon-monoxide dehydrogenase medium subunit
MIPAAFDYELAGTVDEAVALLQNDDAKALAGGHSLIPMMRFRFARPALLVDLGALSELRAVRESGGMIAIGALTRHADVERDPLVLAHCPVLAHAAGEVGDPQVRHRGTIGGSVAHGDPASDLPTVLLALDAEMVARGPAGERTISAADFFTGFYETALGQQDVLTEIRVPGADAGVYLKFSRRKQDWATVGVAAVRAGGAVRVALTNMGATTLRARGVEEALAEGADAGRAAERAAEGTSPPDDVLGSAEYREHLARVLVRRALTELERR